MGRQRRRADEHQTNCERRLLHSCGCAIGDAHPLRGVWRRVPWLGLLLFSLSPSLARCAASAPEFRRKAAVAAHHRSASSQAARPSQMIDGTVSPRSSTVLPSPVGGEVSAASGRRNQRLTIKLTAGARRAEKGERKDEGKEQMRCKEGIPM